MFITIAIPMFPFSDVEVPDFADLLFEALSGFVDAVVELFGQ